MDVNLLFGSGFKQAGSPLMEMKLIFSLIETGALPASFLGITNLSFLFYSPPRCKSKVNRNVISSKRPNPRSAPVPTNSASPGWESAARARRISGSRPAPRHRPAVRLRPIRTRRPAIRDGSIHRLRKPSGACRRNAPPRSRARCAARCGSAPQRHPFRQRRRRRVRDRQRPPAPAFRRRSYGCADRRSHPGPKSPTGRPAALRPDWPPRRKPGTWMSSE